MVPHADALSFRSDCGRLPGIVRSCPGLGGRRLIAGQRQQRQQLYAIGGGEIFGLRPPRQRGGILASAMENATRPPKQGFIGTAGKFQHVGGLQRGLDG